jgi:hypothetical protein
MKLVGLLAAALVLIGVYRFHQVDSNEFVGHWEVADPKGEFSGRLYLTADGRAFLYYGWSGYAKREYRYRVKGDTLIIVGKTKGQEFEVTLDVKKLTDKEIVLQRRAGLLAMINPPVRLER